MAGPRVGQVVDGYRFLGGNPNEASAWEDVKTYQQTIQRERAKRDAARIEEAMQGQVDAANTMATANRAAALLQDDTPTGPMADFRISAGKMFGNTPLSFLPGIPTARQTSNLETLRNIQSQGALGDVAQLKGPLSEKELAFIQRMQVDPNATPETNQRVVEAQRWAAKRQAAYGAALQKWTEVLGSPSAANAVGRTFEQWWGKWSNENLPPPGTTPAKGASGSRLRFNPQTGDFE